MSALATLAHNQVEYTSIKLQHFKQKKHIRTYLNIEHSQCEFLNYFNKAKAANIDPVSPANCYRINVREFLLLFKSLYPLFMTQSGLSLVGLQPHLWKVHDFVFFFAKYEYCFVFKSQLCYRDNIQIRSQIVCKQLNISPSLCDSNISLKTYSENEIQRIIYIFLNINEKKREK